MTAKQKTMGLMTRICRQSLTPPVEMTVSRWAEKYRVLDNASAFPGRWNNAVTPYLMDIMDEMCKPYTQKIIFVKPTQVGGTEALLNILGWSIMYDPSPTMLVYPTDELAKSASESRIQAMIDRCPELKALYLERRSRRQERRFRGMTLYLRSANSPSKLASIAVKRLLLDESDKFPNTAKKEASPYKLAEERTKTFPHTKKIFDNCTPTYTNGHIWQEKETADVERHFFVPCPHCGGEIELFFKQIKWTEDKEMTNAERAESAVYRCQLCDEIIEDISKPFMLRKGAWKEVARRIGRRQAPRKVAFWLNTLYSPFVTWAQIAKEWLDSQGVPEQLQNFVNSWLAEPWNLDSVKLDRNAVLERSSGLIEGVVPEGALLLTGGVDVQMDRFYYTIRAWGESLTSWNIRHGCVETWTDIESVMNQQYITETGKEYFVNLCAVDSGYNTDEVYDFCAQNSEWAAPIKGSSTTIKQKYSFTAIDRNNRGRPSIILYSVDGNFYKTFIFNRLSKEPGAPGAWHVYEDCDIEYAEQICSEERVPETKGGRVVDKWIPKSSRAQNHYWDAEVYAAFAADKLGIRYMKKQTPPPDAPKLVKTDDKPGDDWLKITEEWW